MIVLTNALPILLSADSAPNSCSIAYSDLSIKTELPDPILLLWLVVRWVIRDFVQNDHPECSERDKPDDSKPEVWSEWLHPA